MNIISCVLQNKNAIILAIDFCRCPLGWLLIWLWIVVMILCFIRSPMSHKKILFISTKWLLFLVKIEQTWYPFRVDLWAVFYNLQIVSCLTKLHSPVFQNYFVHSLYFLKQLPICVAGIAFSIIGVLMTLQYFRTNSLSLVHRRYATQYFTHLRIWHSNYKHIWKLHHSIGTNSKSYYHFRAAVPKMKSKR